jgi:SAM-dependent methyltransferase
MLDQLTFNNLQFNSRREVLTGVDATEKYLIKVQIIKNEGKERDIHQEYEIIKNLNQKNCATTPAVYSGGLIAKADLVVKTDDPQLIEASPEEEFGYIIEEYLPAKGNYTLADVIFTMIEQKKLGVYQGDIKPANIRFNADSGICYFIDYDQAIILSQEQIEMDNLSFLKWCSEYDKDKYGIGNWLRHFPQFHSNQLPDLFSGKALDLKQTTIFNLQKTTNSISGIYHSIQGKDIFIDGSRTMDHRAQMLDELEFFQGERVLDVGCNAGLLSMYLHDRGCRATGVDNDPHIVSACKIVSNILGKDINYSCVDLDRTNKLDEYDTIMLFSVLHHTRNVVENAEKVATSCSRIILEARLVESGKQPYGNAWIETSRWNFRTVEQLVLCCEEIFPGFKLRTNLGIADKNRYILELVKA